MEVLYGGIDIAAKSFEICVLFADRPQSRNFNNSPEGLKQCRHWLRQFGVEKVILAVEPTGRYGEILCESLLDAGFLVLEVQPQKFSNYAQSLDIRTKSDPKDALALGYFCKERSDSLKQWQPKTELQYELRDLQLLIRSLTKRIASLKNQRQCGLRSKFVATWIDAEIERIEAEVESALERASGLIKEDPVAATDCALIDTIPGIGKKSALLLVTLIDFRRFSSARSLACFLGLTQRKHQSGTSIDGKKSISKAGNPHIRSALFMPARAARLSNVLVMEFAKRLVDSGKHDGTIQAAVTRKLVCTAWALVVRQVPFDPTYQNHHHPA